MAKKERKKIYESLTLNTEGWDKIPRESTIRTETTMIGDKKRSYIEEYSVETFGCLENGQFLEKAPPEMITYKQTQIIDLYFIGHKHNWKQYLLMDIERALGFRVYDITGLTKEQADAVIGYCRSNFPHSKKEKLHNKSDNKGLCVDIWEDL